MVDLDAEGFLHQAVLDGFIKGCGSDGALQSHPPCLHLPPFCLCFLFSLMFFPPMSMPPVRLCRRSSPHRQFSTQVTIFLHPRAVQWEIDSIVLGSPEYVEAMNHYSKVNIQQSACVVQPATPAQVGTIVRVPFLFHLLSIQSA